MRNYIIPPSINKEKEKIIGGFLDITQAIWIAIGMTVGVLIFFLLSGVDKIFAFVVAAIVAMGIGLPMAFLKIKGYSVLRYFKLKREFDRKKHILTDKK